MPAQSQLHSAFCRNVTARRESLGLSKVALGKRLGVSGPAISQIEAGEAAPGLLLIERLARALEIDPAELLTVDEIVAV